SVTTVEGLVEPDGTLHPVQQAFIDCHGLQCGFCTPGFITTIAAFLEENPSPTRDEATQAIAGNLCRCTGYQNIGAAVLRAAEIKRERCGGSPLGPDTEAARASLDAKVRGTTAPVGGKVAKPRPLCILPRPPTSLPRAPITGPKRGNRSAPPSRASRTGVSSAATGGTSTI